MKALLSLIVDEISQPRDDSFLLNYRKRRLMKLKRNHFILKHILFKEKIPKTETLFKKIKSYSDDIFYSHFGMNWSTFNALKDALSLFWVTAKVGRCGHPLENCLYITLWKLCNNRVTFQQLSDHFNISKGTAHSLFFKTIKAICSLKSEIKWPSIELQQTIMRNFENSREYSFPHVIGCIDEEVISYYDGKGKLSVSIQAICDSQLRFLDVFIAYPESHHEASVWGKSPIFQAITSGELQLAPDAVVLGDSAYPPSTFLMVPYNDNGRLTRKEKIFNKRLCSTRVFIEEAFAIFKQRFKILNHIDISNFTGISNVILACAILHNFIINKGNSSEYIDKVPIIINMKVEDGVGTDQDVSIRSPEPHDINGFLRRNYFTSLFSA